MSTQRSNPPLPVRSPPEAVNRELESLLTEPFARVWERPIADEPRLRALRGRVLDRLAASRAAEAGMFTARRRGLPRQVLAQSVMSQTLYVAAPGQAARPGEPQRARLIELAPGARLAPDALDPDGELTARHCEWLLVSGSARLADRFLSQRDYHVAPAGCAMVPWTSDKGALLFLRESALPAAENVGPFTVRDADAGWPQVAPGIRRRVLWQRDGQAALLYHAQPGAQVPQHTHGHDEECLMVQGELFLDDVLLQPGDYQLAVAGTGHRMTQTDTGVVIYAHGDLDLKFVA